MPPTLFARGSVWKSLSTIDFDVYLPLIIYGNIQFSALTWVKVFSVVFVAIDILV